MKISLYSEYSKSEDFRALDRLDSPTEIVIAAGSLAEYQKRAADYKKASENITDTVYWPQLSFKDGFWISPFSNKSALEEILNEAKSAPRESPLNLMLDLELPLLDKMQFIRGVPNFASNKKLLEEFARNAEYNNINLSTAEMPKFLGGESLQRKLGIAYDPQVIPHMKVPMVYTSLMQKFGKAFGITRGKAKDRLRREASEGLEQYGEDVFGIGLGCIATSENGIDEFLLGPIEFAQDLQIAKKEGIKNAYIYSLRGLSRPEFPGIIKSFSD